MDVGMIEHFRRIAAESGVSLAISDEEAFAALVGEASPRWHLQGGGEVLSAGPPAVPETASFRVTGAGSKIYLDENVALDGATLIAQGRGCTILIGAGCRLRKGTIKVTGNDCTVMIGRNTTWESGAILCSREKVHLVIGEDCMLSNSIMIRTDDGHGIFNRSTRELLNDFQPVVIENHVWIGNGARVNKGTRIGTGTVLGGLSVAAKTLEPNCVYAGVPARKLREDIVWSRTFNFDDIPEDYR